jgi:hypothetical protein
MQKQKGKEYSDRKRSARESDLMVGDRVLTKRMKKDNKLRTEFINEEFIIMTKQGSDVTIKSLKSGKEYRRNTAHLKKLEESNEDSMSNAPNDIISSHAQEPAEEHLLKEVVREKQSEEKSENREYGEQNMGRERRQPSWFQNFVLHYIKKC